MRWADDLDPETLGDRTKDVGTGDGQIGWGHVARRRLTELESEALEARGRGEYEHTGWLDVDRERVGNPARSEHEGSLAGFEDFIAHVEGHLPVEDVPRFILVVMDMERRLGAPKGKRLDEREAALGVRVRNLDGESAA